MDKTGQVKWQDVATNFAHIFVVLVWTDSGQDDNSGFLPMPITEHFKSSTDRFEYCPVFFEKDLSESCNGYESLGSQGLLISKQPLSALPGRYGMTIDWRKAASDPSLAILEIFAFHAASELQYLNMLESLITNHINQAKSTLAKTDITSILHFDYAKTILIRHDAHIESLISWFRKDFRRWTGKASKTNSQDEEPHSLLETDLAYLSTRIRNGIELCEAGREVIMSNASIEEAKQSRKEAQLVTQLTKATNRLTFIFLPISFVTSAFGMNFKQLGQGSLSISLWVWIILPLLAACIILVEKGGYLKDGLMGCLKRRNRYI